MKDHDTAQRPVIGELLFREGLVSRDQLEKALAAQQKQGGRLGYHLIRLGFVDVQRLSRFLRESMGLIPYDLVQWVTDPAVMDHLPASIAQFYQVVPVERKGNVLTVAIADLDNPSLMPALEELTGLRIDPLVCPRETVIRALEHFYGLAKDPGVVRNPAGDHLFVLSDQRHHIRPLHWSTLKRDSSATDWLRTILTEAIRTGCRSMAVKPAETGLKIAMGRQGKMEDRFSLAPGKREEMDALLRELSGIRDSARKVRQEGRVRLQVESRFLTLSVRGMSTLQGTRYALTLYDERLFPRDWDRLGSQLEPTEARSLRSAFDGPAGLVLLCGAPGPGMNHLYYSLLSSLKDRCGPVVSLEEYALLGIEGIAQTEASREEGATWPELVTVALRQEPGLFACFPVKERATMEMILLAAAHTRVLAVLHQPDAAAALRWLLRNQFRSPLRAGILKGVLTAVSIPTLCPRCKLPVEVPGRSGRTYGLQTRQGCEECLAWESLPTEEILEWLPMGPPAIGRIGQEGDLGDLHHAVLEQGGVPLAHRVLLRAQEGVLDGQEAQEYLP